MELDANGLVEQQHLPLNPQRDLRVIEGLLVDVLQQAKTDPNADDYLFIRLTDTHDILDPIGQLRKVYPNTLQLERVNFVLSNGSQLVADVSLKRSEQQVFKDFYAQVIGHELSSAQEELLLETINLAKSQTEAKE